MVNYKFNEGALIQELQDYIDSTYDQHYSKDKFQSSEFIIDCGHGMGFFLGNVLKYTQRYGKKDGANRKDLMKILHYALLALHQHDLDNEEKLKSDLSQYTLFEEGMYNVDDMYYNIDIGTSNYDESSISLSEPTITITSDSIDDATPEEWDKASKFAYRKSEK